MNNNYKVYKLVSPTNLIYIGMTCQKLHNRWNNGKGYKKNKRLYEDIKKYGWENFKHELLFEKLSKSEAEKIEYQMIKKLDLLNERKGYNQQPGGTAKGRMSPMKGKKDNELTKLKKSESHRGEKAYWYGKKLPYDLRQKLSISHKGKKMGKDNSFARKVYQYDLSMNFVKKWDCIEDAARKINKTGSNITACCRGRQKTCGGYIWKYEKI